MRGNVAFHFELSGFSIDNFAGSLNYDIAQAFLTKAYTNISLAFGPHAIYLTGGMNSSSLYDVT